MAVDTTDILPPRYRSPQRVGRGGMGEIYRATDDVLGRAVAVKLLAARYAEDDAVRGRFTREALAAARLSGEPNTVTIFDVGEWQGRPFIVMEYLSGGSLDDVLREEGVQPPSRTLRWLEQAASALDAAHRNGVVHRDVKPGNLLLDREGNVHVADFGIASAAGLDSLTMTGTILGTAGYLSPEQASGERTTPASDRYALAVVAFELLAGGRPFESTSATAEAIAHVNAPVPSLCNRREGLPCELDPVFERALAKDPAARFNTCAELVADLRDALMTAAETTRVFAPVPVAPVTGVTRPLAAPEPRPAASSPPERTHASGPRVGRWLTLLALLVGGGAGGVALAAALTGEDNETASPPTQRGGGVRTRVLTRVQTTTVENEPRTVTRRVTTTAPAPAPLPPPATTAPLPTTTPPTTAPTAPPTTTAPVATTVPPTTIPGAPLTTDEAIAQHDRAFGLIRAGNYAAALPLAQQALASLGGVPNYEAYANYNVGKSLAELGRCDEALPFLDRSQALQGYRAEIASAREACSDG